MEKDFGRCFHFPYPLNHSFGTWLWIGFDYSAEEKLTLAANFRREPKGSGEVENELKFRKFTVKCYYMMLLRNDRWNICRCESRTKTEKRVSHMNDSITTFKEWRKASRVNKIEASTTKKVMFGIRISE